MGMRLNILRSLGAAGLIAMIGFGSVRCSDQGDNPGDPDTTDVDTCLFFPASWDMGEPQIVIKEADTLYNFPCANPSNADEFAYVLMHNSTYELRKHNMQTGEDVLLCNTGPVFSPNWAGNGKIYFGSSGYVYEVDATTGSMSAINAPGALYDPCAGKNNNRMICRFEPPGGIVNAYIAVMDLTGQVTDSVGKGIEDYAWMNDTAFIIFRIDDTFEVFSYPSMQVRATGTVVVSQTLIAHYEGTRFLSSRAGGLYLFDYATQDVTPIVEICGDRYTYSGNSALSGDKSKIIGVRNHREVIDTVSWQHSYWVGRELVGVTVPAGDLQYFSNLP